MNPANSDLFDELPECRPKRHRPADYISGEDRLLGGIGCGNCKQCKGLHCKITGKAVEENGICQFYEMRLHL